MTSSTAPDAVFCKSRVRLLGTALAVALVLVSAHLVYPRDRRFWPADSLTVSPVESPARPRPVLYAVIGSLRGGKEVYCRMAKSLPPMSEVVIFNGEPDLENEAAFSDCLAQHKVPLVSTWHAKEPKNWNDLLNVTDSESRHPWYRRFPPYEVSDPKSHKGFYANKKHTPRQFLGRIHPGHEGTAGILLVYRHLLAQKIKTLDKKYDALVLTRSDFLYLCPEWLPRKLDRIYVLEGETYGGVTDRHAVYPWQMLQVALNVTMWFAHAQPKDLCLQPDCGPYEQVHGVPFLEDFEFNNLESLLALYFTKMGLPMSFYPRVQLTVRRDTSDPTVDATTWSKGESRFLPAYFADPLLVKYEGEKKLAEATCAARANLGAVIK